MSINEWGDDKKLLLPCSMTINQADAFSSILHGNKNQQKESEKIRTNFLLLERKASFESNRAVTAFSSQKAAFAKSCGLI